MRSWASCSGIACITRASTPPSQVSRSGSPFRRSRAAAPARIEERIEELEPPLERFVHALHPWVAFVIMPLFALANSGVALSRLEPSQLAGPIALGTGLGLFVGKQLGIFAFTYAAT